MELAQLVYVVLQALIRLALLTTILGLMNTYTSSNNTATYTLVNSAGCDSIVTLNLTISDSSSSYIYITSCDSYDWNGFIFTNSGIFTQTLTNVNGCIV